VKIRIGYLYGSLMNLYGDRGNVLALSQRAKWRDIETEVEEIGIGRGIKAHEFDLYFFGGGQDQAQDVVSKDLMSGVGKILKEEVERGVPILAICGGYQLLGSFYQPKVGPKIDGVGIFDTHTQAGDERLVGNLVVRANLSMGLQGPDTIVGFENHSGKTYLGPMAKPMGEVILGRGNNGQDKTEGAIYKNAIGCYLHGSLLPKNPHLADWLLAKALEASGQESKLLPLADEIELSAHHAAIVRSKQVA
jgi:lipid II isoglutaminyl synthase (glutamine-hydrolysing)